MKKQISFFLAMTMLMSVLPLSGCGKKNPPQTSGNGEIVVPTTGAEIYDLRTDDMVLPIGVDSKNPEFSWKMRSDEIGQCQTAYQIVVTGEGDSTVWDSGKVASGDSVDIPYGGAALKQASVYRWDLTVWDKNDHPAQASSSFETGIGGTKGFSDAKWISYDPSAEEADETVYTIDFDFILESGNFGICFGVKDANNLIMWQLNTVTSGGTRLYLRPHVKSGGSWSTPAGDIDISEAAGYDGKTVLGKLLHERIEVDGRTIKTYLGEDANSLRQVSSYTHSGKIALGKLAFRMHSNENEVAKFDNLVVRDAAGEIIYQNDFSEAAGFSGTDAIELVDGMLKVGNNLGNADRVFLQTGDSESLPAFRKSFTPAKKIASARLYTTALGVYDVHINGRRVGRILEDGSIEYHELKPNFTEMADRKFYSSYDVTAMITEGSENVLSAVVASGWWSGLVAANYGKQDAFLAKLVLCYDDGSREIITTGTDWKASRASAVTMGDIYNGESYDARVDQSWMLPGYDDSAWQAVKINREFKGEITSWMGSFITVHDELEHSPKSLTVYKGATGARADRYGKINVLSTPASAELTLNPGEVLLVDFGQNFSGWEAFTVRGNAGTVLTIEHGETLNDQNGEFSRGNDGPGGSIYNANYRSAQATTRYTLRGGESESYHPSFTYYGFRYIEITTTETVKLEAIAGQVVSSVEKEIGQLTTSDAKINQLISNIRWGQYSNYLAVPTDCPQRDERMGWSADTQVFVKAGCYLGFSKSFLEKYLQDLRDAQNAEGAYPGVAPTGQYGGGDWGGTGWADAGVIIPYTLYRMYDDISVITDSWASMQKYVDGYLSKFGKNGPRNIWGDWLAYESNDSEIQSILAVAYYAWDAKMMAEMAEAAGYTDQVAKYERLYETEKDYFIEKYVRPDGKLKRGEQSVCLYALYLDLLPDEASVAAVTKQLTTNISRNKNKLQTGFLGTKIILDTLTKIGRNDLAYALLLQENNPSWLYSVLQGATTIWERWNSYTIESGFGDVGMNSFNHYAYGAVAGWMFETMVGIGQSEPGFKRLLVAPQPDARISEVKASYDSAYGLITARSSFDGKVWTYDLTVPANTTAEIRIPMADFGELTVNGKALSELTLEVDGIVCTESGESMIFDAVAGSFSFVRK